MPSTSFDRGGAEGDLMELNGWSTPQMLERYGASARAARPAATTTSSCATDPDPVPGLSPMCPLVCNG
jgi:hypothetical protein